MIPGITNRPVKSTTSAPAGTLRLEVAPIHVILPASITIAEFGAAALPVPSISVKPRRTRTSALKEDAAANVRHSRNVKVLRHAGTPGRLGGEAPRQNIGVSERERGTFLLVLLFRDSIT